MGVEVQGKGQHEGGASGKRQRFGLLWSPHF